MRYFSPKLKEATVKLLPLLAFVVPLVLLYLLNPSDPYLKLSGQDSFSFMWKGRTFMLFFVWLIALEYILGWEVIKTKLTLQNKPRVTAAVIALALPTVYVLLEYYLGLNAAVAGWSLQNDVAFSNSMPLALEYLVFAALFAVTAGLCFGKKGLTAFALPALFVALVGALYTIDNVFPYGSFTPFQLLVPTTTSLAASVLTMMGYNAIPGTDFATSMPTLDVSGPLGTARFAIGWPCAGIESLLIFTAVALLFLKRMHINWKVKVGFFAMGAAVTYFINVLRIANIFIIATQYGVNSHQVEMFHFYYGPLYAMTWIIAYPLLLLGAQALWLRRKNGKEAKKLQPKPLSPV